MPQRRSPLHDNHLRLGAQLVPGGGDYLFPLSYASPIEEHLNTRSNVGMQDLSSMGEVDIKGPGAERLLSRLLVNEVRDMHPGQLRYSTMCSEQGGIIDDITLYKFHDEQFMLVTSSAPRKRTFRWIVEQAAGTSAYVTDISGSIALPVVQGPRSREFLRTLVEDVEFNSLKFFNFARGRIGDTELIVSRSGYTGELGYELYTPAEEAGALWEQLLSAGRAFGLMPYGVTAMHSLRIEKALPLYGKDLSEELTPFHVGLERFIRFEKRAFVGREALLRVQERGLETRWVGLVLQGELPAAADAPVYPVGAIDTTTRKLFSGPEAGAPVDRVLPGSQQIGVVTCSARGHSLDNTLAMAHLNTAHSWPGSRVVVLVKDRPVPAVVTPTPFFDPQGARMRAK